MVVPERGHPTMKNGFMALSLSGGRRWWGIITGG
jgi:hypothetical protein